MTRGSDGRFLKGSISWTKLNGHSETSRNKISESHKKRTNLKKDRTYTVQCPECKEYRVLKHSRYIESIRRNSNFRCGKCKFYKKGQTNSGSFKKGNRSWNTGTGKELPYSSWIKRTPEWKNMRKEVFERDNYTCQICGQVGGVLHPDHIKPKSKFPELVFVIDNVRTLCRECHQKTDTYGGRVNKYNEL